MAEAWAVVKERPLAFGGWEFILVGPSEKRLEWWPGDTCLSWLGSPFRGAPVEKNTGKAARLAAHALVAKLNEDEVAA